MASTSPDTTPRPKRSRLRRILVIAAIWTAELAVLFVVAEIASIFFLPAGLRFYYPQKLEIPSERRIFTHQPNQHSYTVDKPFVTNSLGLRGAREVPADKAGELRIYSGGDSLAEGLGAAEEDTYAFLLEKSLSQTAGKVRVINAGIGGYGTWQEVDLLEEKLTAVQPDIAIIEFYWNDLYVTPEKIVPLPKSMSAGQGEATLWVSRLTKRSRVLSFLREKVNAAWYSRHPTFDWALEQKILDGQPDAYLDHAYHDVGVSLARFKALADEHHFAPILLILPMTDQVLRPDAPTHMQQRVEAMARAVGLPTLDPLSTLRKAAGGPDLFLPWDHSHFSPRGHQVIADFLTAHLTESGLLVRQNGR